MNIALPALALLLLVLPGFIAIYTYKGSLRPQDDALVSSASMTMGWVLSLFAAGVAHAAWIPLANFYSRRWGSGAQVDLGSVIYLLAGEYKDVAAFKVFEHSLTDYPYSLLSYFATLYFVVTLSGLLLNWLVLHFQLDLKVGFLKFNNRWHYLFQGDKLPNNGVSWVTVTCCHKTHTCLYAGLLQSYEFSSDGEIERLTLRYARRADFKGNMKEAPKFVPIPGDLFVIWCRDVNTLSLRYVIVGEDSGSPDQVPLPFSQGG